MPNGLVIDQWEYPWKMEHHFLIQLGQQGGMALTIS